MNEVFSFLSVNPIKCRRIFPDPPRIQQPIIISEVDLGNFLNVLSIQSVLLCYLLIYKRKINYKHNHLSCAMPIYYVKIKIMNCDVSRGFQLF